MKEYIETFDSGPGGWIGVRNNFEGPYRLKVQNGVISSYGPWWVDYNHAPPGAGYLSLLMSLPLTGPLTEAAREMGGANRFIEGGYPLDFRNAEITVTMKGEIDLQGAGLHLLAQGTHEGICSGWVLTGQKLEAASQWSDQKLVLRDDPAQWTALGSRHDRCDTYGVKDLSAVLSRVNVNIYLVLFPLQAVPKGPIQGDPHLLRAGYDYPLWQTRLPDGYLMVDTVTIAFP